MYINKTPSEDVVLTLIKYIVHEPRRKWSQLLREIRKKKHFTMVYVEALLGVIRRHTFYYTLSISISVFRVYNLCLFHKGIGPCNI